MSKRNNFATVTFADDLRHESNGKRIVVGVYGRDIIFNELPQSISQIWACIRYGTDIDNVDLPVLVEVVIPGAEDSQTMEVNMPPPPPNFKDDPEMTVINVTLDFRLENLDFTESGTIKAYVHTQSGERVPAGRLNIVDLSEKEKEETSATIPFNAFPMLVVNYAHMIAQGNTSDAADFANEAFKVLGKSLIGQNIDEIKKAIGDRVPVGPQHVAVIFPEPLKEAPALEVIPHYDDVEAIPVDISRFGFGVVWSKKVENPNNFTYNIVN